MQKKRVPLLDAVKMLQNCLLQVTGESNERPIYLFLASESHTAEKDAPTGSIPGGAGSHWLHVDTHLLMHSGEHKMGPRHIQILCRAGLNKTPGFL